jgi:deoxyadenosine/deoxycytidine kinase
LFYDNPRKWTFQFQQLAINTAASEYKENQTNNGINFFERSIYSPLKIFAQQQFITGALTLEEMDLHEKITNDIMKWINYDIKGIIYVRTSPEVAQ